MAAFDWSDYLTIAETFIRNRNPAFQRAALSRAYYAAFCTARNELVRLRYQIPNNESHRWLWQRFCDDFHGLYVRVGEKGDYLRKLRRKADYDNEYRGNLELEAAYALVAAREILDILSQRTL